MVFLCLLFVNDLESKYSDYFKNIPKIAGDFKEMSFKLSVSCFYSQIKADSFFLIKFAEI